MSWLTKYFRSSIGAKHLMAITGIGLVGFVLAHMLGNLQVFKGPDALNSYAEKLQSLGGLLWVARGALLLMIVVHIASALQLVVHNKKARPIGYQVFKHQRAPFYARVMPMTGLIVLAFIVFHVLHFTLGMVQPAAHELMDAKGRHDVYRIVVIGFQNTPIAISYIVAMALFCMHLAHGVTSMFQSLGLNHPKYNGLFSKAGPVIALLVFVGNVSMPIACLTNIIKLPGA